LDKKIGISMFFENWDKLLNIFFIGILSYIAMVFLLRISGKRTLSKWNAFDFIVTVALGSSLATSILSKDVKFSEGVLGFTVLIFLQFLVTWLSVRIKRFQKFIKAEPAFLLKKGKFLRDVMKYERVTESEIHAALRSKGISDTTEIFAIVLETDGSFSIIESASDGPGSTLKDVVSYNNN
jgi:uncharacterized membrane protein YcaP (DUF421 family)